MRVRCSYSVICMVGIGIERLLLRLADVEALCGLSKSEIYRRLREGEFPQPIMLADRVSRWVGDEIRAWVAAKISEHRARPKDAALPPHPLREYWANHRGANHRVTEAAPAAQLPPRKPRKPTRPPPKLTKPKTNGHRAPETRTKALVPKKRGRPPTLSAEEKAGRLRARREADREYRRVGREALRAAAEREATQRQRGRSRRAAQREDAEA